MSPAHSIPPIDPAPVSPPRSLEDRVRRAYRRRRNQLRGGAAACAVALAVVLLVPATAPDNTAPATAPAPLATTPDPTLQALDRALQAAYARGASDAELAPLWAARRQVIATPRSRS